LRGSVDVAPDSGIHVMCYCDDCQAFAHELRRAELLDAHGGSELWVTTPSRFRLSAGLGQLRCLRLSAKGLLRWHSGCCNTPVANTLVTARGPFVSMYGAFLAPGPRDLPGKTYGVQGRFAIGGLPPGAHATSSLGLLAKASVFMARSFVTGARLPTPLFAAGGQPVVAPRVLSVAERQALRPVAG